MTSRAAARLAWFLCGLSVVMAAVTLAFSYLNRFTVAPLDYGTRGGAAVAVVALLLFPIVGALIASRQPGNSVGWLCLSAGLGMAVQSLAREYAGYSLETAPGSLPGGVALTWLANWMWPATFGLSAIFLVLLFPDGHLPDRAARVVAWFGAGGIVSVCLTLAFAPGRMENARIANPFALESAGRLLEFLSLGIFLLPLAFVGSAVSMVRRFRRSRGLERQQLKWFASGAALVATVFALQIVLSIATGAIEDFRNTPFELRLLQDVVTASFAAIPIASGIAILRYRLYDIDRIINRTLVYATLTAVLGTIYVGCVVVLPSLVGGAQRESQVLVAGTTLLLAALFQPLRRGIQSLIDRRFYRSRYDSARTVESFSARLRDEMELDAVMVDLLASVRQTLQPEHASLWLRAETER